MGSEGEVGSPNVLPLSGIEESELITGHTRMRFVWT